MKKLRLLVSLTTDDNDYQMELANAAKHSAAKFGVELQLMYASNDGIVQSQQLLTAIQSTTEPRPDAIIFEPAGSTALPHVARAAAAAGIGWVVLNREADYLADLRRSYHTPAFCITSQHEEIGRIQGKQLRALLPTGGTVLYMQGPSESGAAKQRLFGALETKTDEITLRVLKAQWTEASACKSAASWLRLSTARDMRIDAVCAQDDSMAMGVRKAIEECHHAEREKWVKVPFLGCDGMPKTGQEWVRRGLLTATVFIPPTTDIAIDMIVRALQTGVNPPERTFTAVKSIPAIESLGPATSRSKSAGQ